MVSDSYDSPELRCRDCYTEITLIQYRRKVPRCDDCEVESILHTWWVGYGRIPSR